MPLTKQFVDIPTVAGVDTKTDSVNDIPPALADLNNLRFTNTGAYDPRPSFDALQELTATSTDFITEGRDAVLSSVDRYLYKTIDGINAQVSPIWSPKGRNLVIAGGTTSLGLDTAVTRMTSVTLTDGRIFYVWRAGSTGFGYQFVNDEGELLASGYHASPVSSLGYILATAGPSGSAFVWITSGAGALTCFQVTTSGVTAITPPAISSISRFSIIYSSTDSAWYTIHTNSGSGAVTLSKLTISGTTISSVGSVAAEASGGAFDVDVIRSTTYVVIGYWASGGDIKVRYYDTSLVLQATQTRTPSVSSPSYYIGFGICETSADAVFCSVTNHYNDSGPVLHAFSFTTSSAANVWDANPVGFISPTPPICVNSRVYLYAVDATVPGAQSSSLLQIANYDGGSISAFALSAQWAGDETVLTGFIGSFGLTASGVKSRMCKTANTLCVPYHRSGAFLYTSSTTIGNASGIASSQITTDYSVVSSLGAAMQFSLVETPHSQAFNIGTSTILTSTYSRTIDGSGAGPSSAWPVPYPYNRTLTTGGVVGLGEYTYVYVKAWTDSLGNRQTLETLPVRVSVEDVGGTVYNVFGVYFPPSAFKVYDNSSATQIDAVIEVYRTEANGTIPYLHTTLLPSTSMPFSDLKPDSDLIFQIPLNSSSGELTNTIISGSKTATLWKGRLAILPIDYDDRIYFSKPAEDFRFPSFAAGLQIDVPQTSSPLTALGVMDGVLYAFTNNQVYTIYGDPPGNTGEGGSLTIPEIRFNGVGCEDPASVLLTPVGLFFKSAKGIYVILRNQELVFVGNGPFEERDETVVGAWADENTSEVAFALESGEVWVYDWGAKGWSRWTPPIGASDTITGAALVNNLPTYITQDGIYQQVAADTETFTTSITTSWIRLGALQGYQRVYNMWLYLERLADHTLTVDMYIDGSETSVYTWSIASTGLATTVPEQIRLSVPVQKCSAIKLKIASTNAGWKLKGIMAEIGVKDSTFKSRNAPNNY